MALNIANVVLARDYHDNTNDLVIETSTVPVALQASFDSGATWVTMNQDGTGLWSGSQYWMARSSFDWNTTNTVGFTGDVWIREQGTPATIIKWKIRGYVYNGSILDGVTFITKQNGSNVDVVVQTQAGTTGNNNSSVTLNGAAPSYQSPGAAPICQWKFNNVATSSTAYNFSQGGSTVSITYDSAVFTGGSSGGGTGSLVMTIPTGGTLEITTLPTNGTISITGQTITYTPNAGFTGTDSFGYTIKGASGEVLGTGTCTLDSTTTAVPSFAKSFIDVTGDIRVNCTVGATVRLYKNAETTVTATLTDTNKGYVDFTNISRIQGDTFTATAQKSPLSVSNKSIICTVKRKPLAKTTVSKQLASGATNVTISLTELVDNSENGSFF